MSQGLVSLIERGHSDRVSMRVILAVARALDARVAVQLRWRAGDLDRLLDADHAVLSAAMLRRLEVEGWLVRAEVTYAFPRSAGSIDILAWHPAGHSLLVIEIKTEISSAEAVLRKLDEKASLAATVALGRFGWVATSVSKLLVIEETSTNRRRVNGADALFASSLPVDGRSIRAWLAQPSGAVAGRLFLSATNRGSGIQTKGGRHRVRPPKGRPARARLSVCSRTLKEDDGELAPGRTLLVG